METTIFKGYSFKGVHLNYPVSDTNNNDKKFI